MPLDLKEVDEVWLALEQAASWFISNGHHPTEYEIQKLDCSGCYCLGLVTRGMEAYKTRTDVLLRLRE